VRNVAGSPTKEVRAIVGRGRALLSRAVRTAWDKKVLTRDPDGLFSGVLGADDVDRLLEEADKGEILAPQGAPPPVADGHRVARLTRMLEGLGCDEIAEEILTVALAIELDAPCRMLSGYLRGGATSNALTIGSMVLALGDESIGDVLVALGAGAPLRRHRMIEMIDKSGEILSGATLRAAPRVLRWLLDPDGVDDEVAEIARFEAVETMRPLAASAAKVLETSIGEVVRFLETQRGGDGGRADLVLRGPRGAGRSEVAREACRRLGIPVLSTSLPTLLAQQNPADAAAALLRESLLLEAQIILDGGESLSGQDEPTGRVRSALGASTQPLILTSNGPDQPRLAAGRRAIMRDVRIAATNEREDVWRELLPEVDAAVIGSLYRIGTGAIARVSEGARLRAEVRRADKASHLDVAEAVRAEFETDLGTVATRIDVSQNWNDLVVPDDTGRTIAELVDQLRHRSMVLGRWGFQRKLGKGVGTTALFSGEPGTGKSMVAGLIAKELGLEMYQIDLSRVLSKWIGETEKNLSKVFDAAETGHVVLLFDEADALLGKRTTDVKSANDRYANIETNYILQRLEQFHGVAILTSNLESSIDPALSRRLSFELRFPFPDEEQRAELWKRMLPDELPIDGEIDFMMLATRFELAGGHIRNIVLRAAYLAAGEGAEAMAMAHLMRAAEYEYRDHGMLIARGRLKT